jgi:hypothetical protein
MNPQPLKMFSELSSVNFNHAGRDDSQQVFMERLEIVAVEMGLKPAFAAGQSGYNAGFNRGLEKFGIAHGFRAIRTPSASVFTQLLALDTHQIPRSFLEETTVRFRQSPSAKNREAIWLFKDAEIERKILLCVEGNFRMGDVFGYPTCCTDDYLRLEARKIEIELDHYRCVHAAKSNSDFLRLYENNVEITGQHAVEVEKIGNSIMKQQAISIKQFPFVHFIACPNCVDSSHSAAFQLNAKMETLAGGLNKTFARKFTHYAAEYFKMFQETRL